MVVFGAPSVVAVEPPRVAVGVPGGEERCATGVYELTCAPMGVPRVWTIKRNHGLPLGEWGTHRDGLVAVFCRRR